MKTFKIVLTAFLLALALGVAAQSYKAKGKVLSPENKPVRDAVVSLTGAGSSVVTNKDGEFEIATDSRNALLTVKANGFYTVEQPLAKRSDIKIILVSENKSKYNEEIVMPMNEKGLRQPASSSVNLGKKDFGGVNTIEKALAGEIAGLRVTGKSGMPGEGAYFNLRGIRSLNASNQPLVVINGVPYLPDTDNSPIIGGYSRGLFNAYDLNDIANITVLKGAEASIYGSMGSNGVILIETDGASSEDMDTRISFSGQYGMNWNDRTLPMLSVDGYKSYLNNVGMTHYSDMAELHKNFPFLVDDPNYYYNYLYNNNTDWQKEIRKPSFVTDNVLRVEGGDAIAKYDIAIGYMKDGGILDNTDMNRYHTQINTNITVSRKFEIFTTVGMAYTNANLMEQGMLPSTNPILAAYSFAPVFSPYVKEADGSHRPAYNTVRYGVSNPVAIVNSLVAKNKMYDVNIRAGLKYKPLDNLTFTGVFGLYYNYDQENVFIPGVSSGSILPQTDGLAKNTVRAGVGEAVNMYYNINAAYSKVFNDIHALNVNIGGQVITSRKEFDAGSGYNTANDFYQTLDYVTSGTEMFFGYINMWNWMNYYAHADYTYKGILKGSVNVAVDGASSTGIDATRFGAFPSIGATFMAKNTGALLNSSFLSRLDIRAEYGLTGNSRFSSNYAKNYYHSSRFMEFSGIVRSTVPNTKLKWENNKQLNLGVDLSLFKHRFDLSFDYYDIKSSDVLFAQPAAAVYGTADYYNNAAEISNRGVELSLRAALVQTKNFEWVVGGNIAFMSSKVNSLGTVREKIMTKSDGSQVITRVGKNPYAFYGYRTEGVFASEREAKTSGLLNSRGEAFQAGDVRFVDINKDGVIDDQDKMILGKATPDFFGGFYTSLRYKGWNLSAEFTYSSGNDAYNAVRRYNESMSTWANQSGSVANRWQFDGQITDVPRAVYGDPMDNNRFSDRWIEDASYLKLKNVTLGYTVNKPFFKIFRSAHFYVAGENLCTFTKYLGMDPEFAYSFEENIQGFDYAKAALPRSVRFGLNLKF